MACKCENKILDNVNYLSGRLDETFHLIADTLPSFGDVTFNLKDMTSVNSSGVRQWILLMRKMKAAQIYFYECPKVIVDQANMVKDFIPSNAKIISFYVPYFNEKNGTEKSVLFKLDQDYTTESLLPLKKVFDDQGDEMEIDVVESKYFKFIKF